MASIEDPLITTTALVIGGLPAPSITVAPMSATRLTSSPPHAAVTRATKVTSCLIDLPSPRAMCRS